MADWNKVQWVYSAGSQEELAKRYDEWAVDYDSDLERDFGWNGHEVGVETFVKYVSTDARVIDVGVGTGLAGWELVKRGFSLLDGFDLSQGMLDVAKGKGWYRALQIGILGENLGYPDDQYDAAIATGVFSVGHAPASGFDEVVRIVKSGGYFVITLRPDIYEANGFKAKEQDLAAAGKLQVVEVTDSQPLLAKGEPDIQHQVRVYRVL